MNNAKIRRILMIGALVATIGLVVAQLVILNAFKAQTAETAEVYTSRINAMIAAEAACIRNHDNELYTEKVMELLDSYDAFPGVGTRYIADMEAFEPALLPNYGETYQTGDSFAVLGKPREQEIKIQIQSGIYQGTYRDTVELNTPYPSDYLTLWFYFPDSDSLVWNCTSLDTSVTSAIPTKEFNLLVELSVLVAFISLFTVVSSFLKVSEETIYPSSAGGIEVKTGG
ncbi:MAG: hypothetical protein LBR73_02475 [Oscillospiraceae bacterium]|jgi:hypothetical protein|nr:hypothetical protein [Oscillospiraceae bacterium]